MKLKNALLIILFLLASSYFGILLADNKTGTFQESLDGTHYWAFVPDELAKKENLPLVVALHGSGGNAQNFIRAWTPVASAKIFPVISIKSKGQTWTPESDKLVLAAIEHFSKICSINPSEILLTGFSAGAHVSLMTAIRHHKKFKAVACVGGGMIRGLSQNQLEEANHLSVYFVVGEKDPNYNSIKQIKPKLESADYSVKLTVAPNLGHQYPNDASSNIWDWFVNISGFSLVEKLKVEADKTITKTEDGIEVEDIIVALAKHRKFLTEYEAAYSKFSKDEKVTAKKYKKEIEENIEKIYELWEEKEPKEFKALKSALNLMNKGKYYDAYKKLAKILKNFEDSDAGKFAKEKMLEIISTHQDVADKLAGSKPKSKLKKAQKYLNKKKPRDSDIEKAHKILREVIADYPYTSYAAKAKKLLSDK